MTKRILLVVAALSVALAPAAPAQRAVLESVPEQLSLADAIAMAKRHNPSLRQAENDVGAAVWGVRNAYASFLPRFDASTTFSYSGQGSQRFLTTEFSSGSATIGSSYGLGLSLNLSGQTFQQPGLARAELQAAEASFAGAEINLESIVRQQYLLVLEALAQVELARLQVTRNDEFLRLARAQYEVGQNTLLDVRQAEVARGQAAVSLLQAEQTVVVEQLRLFQQIGVPAPIDLASVTLTTEFPITEPGWDLQELLQEAEERNPDLLALRGSEASARASARAAKSDWLPSLSIQAGWRGFTQEFTDPEFLVLQAEASAQSQFMACQTQNTIIDDVNTRVSPGLATFPCDVFTFTAEDAAAIRQANDVFPFDFTRQPFGASITISLPIFTQFGRPRNVAQANAVAEDAREAVRARELTVNTEVSRAFYALDAAYQAIGIQEENRIAAREQLRLATERYRVGSGTFFELLDAQLAAQTAERDYITAVYAYHRSIATLESAVGRPLR